MQRILTPSMIIRTMGAPCMSASPPLIPPTRAIAILSLILLGGTSVSFSGSLLSPIRAGVNGAGGFGVGRVFGETCGFDVPVARGVCR